ncbi:cytochrome c family protein [Cereibacter azotoformans]|uniref:Cytochrome cY n=3 Tax=Cereibacter TaxID=1653176 RepID=Q2LAG8_CERSP|nr:cytochrome c family protein [Cereibacter azotoformans]ABC69310.1 cytochrome cY [Cereibacter sphaeroides]AXQ92752.1 cytochrome c family protein [Cereibacter sphaeroides]MBO4169635.1 cytochrome c family protein [Cereibacter azotoformans]PTR14912.1 cytochrome c [Cereibacter azotoformans]UIJ31035.1 cytochrome c family protein [Cereibacter azotoformans]
MFDTMTLTKAVGAGCGALLVFLLGSWAATGLYTTGGGHGEDAVQAYVIETGGGGAAEEEPDAEAVPFAELVAAADPAAGQKVYAKCAACHKLDGSNATGPHLDGIIDRAVAGVDGFAYSDAMVAHAADAPAWTVEELGAFVQNPRSHVPGTKMTFAGLPKEQDRADVVAYLASLQ